MSQDSTVVPPTPQVSPPTPQVSAPFLDISPELPAQETYQLTNLPPTYYNDQKQSEPTLVRAGLSTQPRLLLMTSIGSFWGFSMGALLGGRQSGLQYLAENAHKLPTTVQGWYFYHKTKNYRMMLGGVKRGIRFAGKTGGLCLLYGALEAALDDVRGEADIINSVTAGITTGTIFSALTRLTRGSFRYSVFFGAMFGLAAGGLSDLHRYASGDTPSYVQKMISVAKNNEKDV